MRGQIVGTGAQQTWRRLTSAPVGNTPIGTIHAIYTNVCPTGYLPCDGSAYDTTQFPDLYALLTTAGVTNPDHTPDFRECALVGVGNNSTDTFGTHDIYTLGQFKDCQAQALSGGTLSIKSAGYTVSGNNVILNSTVNAANRKLVTQYIADASATDLQTITVGSGSGATTTRNRSKGVYWIIKATVGNEISDINQLADDLRDEMALCMQLKPVNVLPTGADITTDMYYCNGTYYVGQVNASDPTQSICVPLDTAVVSNTVAEDNMGAVTSNAVWEQSHYENAVRLNFYPEDHPMTSGQGISIPATNDTADKQIQYMLNYVRDISIAKDKPLVYCGICRLFNAANTTSIACTIDACTFQITVVKGETSYYARGLFSNTAGNANYSNVIAAINQNGAGWILRQCNVSISNTVVANNITITAAAPTSTYTADRDGEVYVHVTNQTGGYTPSLVINGVVVDTCPFHRAGACTLRGRISKGDTYRVITDCPSGDTRMFINCMGIQGINHWTSRATSW